MTPRTTRRAAYHRADEDPPTAVLPRVDTADPEAPTAGRSTERSAGGGEPAPDDHAPVGRRRGRVGSRGPLLFAVLALVAAVLAGAVAGTRWSASAERSAVQDAARSHAESLLTIDPEQAVDQARAVAEASTGGFADLYRGNADTYLAAVRDGQVRMTVDTVRTGVDSVDGDTAWTLSLVEVEKRDVENPAPATWTYRLVQELRREDGRWLVSRVDFVG